LPSESLAIRLTARVHRSGREAAVATSLIRVDVDQMRDQVFFEGRNASAA